MAMESGLIMNTGLIAWMAFPACWISCRMGRWPRFRWNSWRRMPTWPPASRFGIPFPGIEVLEG